MPRGSNSWTTSTNAFEPAFDAETDGGARVVKVKSRSNNSEDLLAKVTYADGTSSLDIIEAGESEYYGTNSESVSKVEVKSAGGTAAYNVVPLFRVL